MKKTIIFIAILGSIVLLGAFLLLCFCKGNGNDDTSSLTSENKEDKLNALKIHYLNYDNSDYISLPGGISCPKRAVLFRGGNKVDIEVNDKKLVRLINFISFSLFHQQWESANDLQEDIGDRLQIRYQSEDEEEQIYYEIFENRICCTYDDGKGIKYSSTIRLKYADELIENLLELSGL